ncbi:MAG: hypothetical protein A2830_00885 [Candidatus Taylorbacteria bacterium RIFCSPHIGHO2_01_FULL_44_110]|nr:MAG: hypothetical protein A2830_00885 [Candidatus Taylorbacteria bacterium RIFCSPHIGHO2_01_FULL_44_110]OHA39013.1 MAG: hypothetical protein A3I98_00025 [Candidatus Taylorbacteria bacterium RIFCSPLOWO2_02_FULL_45_10b]
MTVCLPPIGGCLIAAESMASASSDDWQPQTKDQRRFIREYYMRARGEICALPEIESVASESVSTINEFLEERGFQIKLEEFKKSSKSFGVASVFKLFLEWIKPGRITSIRNRMYPAVYLEAGVSFFRSKHSNNPILSVKAKNGDIVSMTILSEPPVGFDLLELIGVISTEMKPAMEFDGAIFPMIDYNREIDISWMEGMKLTSSAGPWVIEQALQQTKFRMNELGAKVESAASMGIRLLCCTPSDPPLVIDKPFLLWVNRSSFHHPLFVGYFAEENWKRPGKL